LKRKGSPLNPRDDQIRALKARTERLKEIPDRLEDCYQAIARAYADGTIVDHAAQVYETDDRKPSGFRVLSNQEARRLTEFNDTSYYWEFFCEQLGRSIAIAEESHLTQQFADMKPDSNVRIDAAHADFSSIERAVRELSSRGYRPDTMFAPISVYVSFNSDENVKVDWNASPREALIVPNSEPLKLFWSSQVAPLDRFVIYDSRAVTWEVKRDPGTKSRLTVAIGERESRPSQPDAVMFLAETVVKCTIANPDALYVIPVQGQEGDVLESTRTNDH